MNKILLSSLLLVFAPAIYGQTVSLVINTSGFQDSNSIISNDMAWGIVVDTTGIGFSSLTTGSLEPFSFPSFNQSLDIGDGLVFHRAPSNTSNSGPPTFSDGFIGTLTDLPINANPSANGVSTSHLYGLIWFPSINAQAGDPFGFIDLGLSLPAEGSTVDISSFVNPDAATFTAVPEPSTYAAIVGLLALAIVGFRRFRS